MTGIAVAQRGATTPDGVLVQEAAAGSGVSYGVLYDRYAKQVFNYCLRLTGSPEDAADATQEAFVNVLRRLQDDDRPVLEFSSYLFVAARNESYALMRQRARMRPSDSPPEDRGRVADVATDPVRAALLRDSQEAVREANAQLEPRHREVLALREVAGRSYDEVGQIMGVSGNAAAQLIWRARSKLREALTAGAVASVVATSEECETAQLLLNRVQDGEPVEEADRLWLDEHLEECGSCKTANRMLLEVGASYRSWMPVALLAGMREGTLTRAGEVVGADWGHVTPPGKTAGSTSGGTGGTVAAAAGAVIVAAGIAFVAITGDSEVAPVASGGEQPAARAPSVSAQSAQARGDPASAADPGAKLTAARAPRAAGSPALAKPPIPTSDRSDGPAVPENAPDPLRRPQDGSPSPRGSPAPPVPTPSEPRAEPPARPVDPGPPARPVDPGPPARPVDPRPPAPAPPADATPPGPAPPPASAPPPSECSWPGQGGGPGGCPPGHGGVPPGQGGTPPGRTR